MYVSDTPKRPFNAGADADAGAGAGAVDPSALEKRPTR